jgi:hypothetical protein
MVLGREVDGNKFTARRYQGDRSMVSGEMYRWHRGMAVVGRRCQGGRSRVSGRDVDGIRVAYRWSRVLGRHVDGFMQW